MTNSVKELLEAAKRAQILLRGLTIRDVFEAGNGAIDAAGLNPYCINEGMSDGSEGFESWWLDSAIAAVESEGDACAAAFAEVQAENAKLMEIVKEYRCEHDACENKDQDTFGRTSDSRCPICKQADELGGK